MAFKFLTGYEDRGFETKVPQELRIEARGVTASTINETINAYANAAFSFLPLIALSANAWIGEPEIKLAFDDTPGRSEREFFQSFTTPLEPDAVRFGRPIDREATAALVVAIGTHPTEGHRLRRAAEQYRMALSNWLRGQEALAIGHLWMAVEALTKVAQRRECVATGLQPPELASAWGIRLRDLDGEVRRRLIFQGDAASARTAREASDGLEHAFLDFGEVRELARGTRDETARYVREAIFEFADLGEPWRSRLLADQYRKPLKSWIVRYLRGKLLGDVDELAAPGEPFPIFDRTPEMTSLTLRPDGSYHFEMNENFRAKFSEDIQFQGTALEVWGEREETSEAASERLELEGGEERGAITQDDTS